MIADHTIPADRNMTTFCLPYFTSGFLDFLGWRVGFRGLFDASFDTVSARRMLMFLGGEARFRIKQVPELALFLMSGGFKGETSGKRPGEMSRGTSSITDLPKRWMADFLGRLETHLPKDVLHLIYLHKPALLVRMFRLETGIAANPDGKPVRIASYFPRNYIGLEKTVELRCNFGHCRRRRIARVLTD